MLKATEKLLKEIISQNQIKVSDIASVIFSVTEDLDAAFPAEAARQLGWKHVPLLCTVEIAVPESLKKCVRILMHVNTDKDQDKIKFVYLEEAKILRGDHQ